MNKDIASLLICSTVHSGNVSTAIDMLEVSLTAIVVVRALVD